MIHCQEKKRRRKSRKGHTVYGKSPLLVPSRAKRKRGEKVSPSRSLFLCFFPTSPRQAVGGRLLFNAFAAYTHPPPPPPSHHPHVWTSMGRKRRRGVAPPLHSRLHAFPCLQGKRGKKRWMGRFFYAERGREDAHTGLLPLLLLVFLQKREPPLDGYRRPPSAAAFPFAPKEGEADRGGGKEGGYGFSSFGIPPPLHFFFLLACASSTLLYQRKPPPPPPSYSITAVLIAAPAAGGGEEREKKKGPNHLVHFLLLHGKKQAALAIGGGKNRRRRRRRPRTDGHTEEEVHPPPPPLDPVTATINNGVDDAWPKPKPGIFSSFSFLPPVCIARPCLQEKALFFCAQK